MARNPLAAHKVTISLTQDLLCYADARAQALGITRSQVIGQALAELRTREAEELAREGYAFYARESEEFARASLTAVSEAVNDAS